MVFWLAILAAALFARLATDVGFYQAWVMLFNIVIAVYLAVFLTPLVVAAVPAAADTDYGEALTLAAIAVGTFAILHGVCSTFLTGENVSFPEILDTLGAGLLGFLGGFLILSFVAFLICVTPIAENTYVKRARLDRQSQQANISYLCWWCDMVHAVVSSEDNQLTSEQAIDKLVETVQSKVERKKRKQVQPKTPIDPDEVEPSLEGQEGPSPPQDTDPEDAKADCHLPHVLKDARFVQLVWPIRAACSSRPSPASG